MASQCHSRPPLGIQNPQQDAGLFKLPLELLLQIYRYLFGNRTIFVSTKWSSQAVCWEHCLVVRGPDQTHDDNEDCLHLDILKSCTWA